MARKRKVRGMRECRGGECKVVKSRYTVVLVVGERGNRVGGLR